MPSQSSQTVVTLHEASALMCSCFSNVGMPMPAAALHTGCAMHELSVTPANAPATAAVPHHQQ